jgi:HYR domain-containing protein
MKRYAIATAVTLLGVFSWSQTPKADAPTYTVQVLSSSASIANIDNFVPFETGINASGQVSGYVQDANWNTRAVFYTGTAWQYVPGTTWGSTASGINIHGDIVGSRVVGPGTITHAFRYNAATGLIDDIPPLTVGRSSYGFGINDNGDVVGQTDVSLNVFRAFVARFGQSPLQLPSLGGTSDSACGINNFGQIAETTGSGGQHAARVEADGSTILDAGTLDGPAGVSSAACAIDDFGHIGGSSSYHGFNELHAFRWDPGDPVMADAGLSSVNGNVFSIAGGVSVGYYQTATGPVHALMHTDANGAVDLNALLPANSGWVLTEALGVNASGQIVGDGMFNDNPAVFLMSPAKAKDTTPPVIAAHADVTAEATGPSGAIVSYSAPGTTDNVDAPGTAVCTPASGWTFPLGATTVTCQATDAAGNAATPTTFNVIVKDTTPPVIAWHADVTAEATGPTGASVTYTPPATTDAVDGTRSATCKPASGWTFPLGTTTVTCNANDAAGNAAVPTTFSVIVKDTTAPVISTVHASPNAIWPPDGKMVPVSVTVTATDVVDPSPSCSLTSISGGSAGSSTITGQFSANVRSDNGAAYILTVTCRDFSGNTSSLSTSVAVTKTNGNGATPKTIKTATNTAGHDADRDDHDRDDHDRHDNRDGRNDRDDRGRDRAGKAGIDR